MKDVNVVTLMCRLTRDPELRSLASGMSVCSLRVAFSTSRKNPTTSEWEDKSNFVDVTVWGNQGDACAKYLAKGRQVCVYGRLEWREWTADDGSKRQAHQVVAEQVQFVGDGSSQAKAEPGETYSMDDELGADPVEVPVATSASADEDIPF